jgi:ribonuclease Z
MLLLREHLPIPTSQILEIKNNIFLIDCGEGTQVQLRKTKLNFLKVNHIFYFSFTWRSFFGLIGLISTFTLLGRTTDLYIHGPVGKRNYLVTIAFN